jgi:hypothetical protein
VRDKASAEWPEVAEEDDSGVALEGAIELGEEVEDPVGMGGGVEVVEVGVGVGIGVEVGVGVEVEVEVEVGVGVGVPLPGAGAVAAAGPPAGAAAAAPPVAAPLAPPPGPSRSGSIEAIANPNVRPLSAKASVARNGIVRLTQRDSSAM